MCHMTPTQQADHTRWQLPLTLMLMCHLAVVMPDSFSNLQGKGYTVGTAFGWHTVQVATKERPLRPHDLSNRCGEPCSRDAPHGGLQLAQL